MFSCNTWGCMGGLLKINRVYTATVPGLSVVCWKPEDWTSYFMQHSDCLMKCKPTTLMQQLFTSTTAVYNTCVRQLQSFLQKEQWLQELREKENSKTGTGKWSMLLDWGPNWKAYMTVWGRSIIPLEQIVVPCRENTGEKESVGQLSLYSNGCGTQPDNVPVFSMYGGPCTSPAILYAGTEKK